MDNLDDVVLPDKVDDLITLLNKVYPEKSPELSDDTKTIYFKAGQRDVVKFINTLKNEISYSLDFITLGGSNNTFVYYFIWNNS